ncbi:MAG: phytanoyl-CoA dioxygenase family protein [Piscinibacter sp.]
MLTPAQKRRYRDDGYLVLEGFKPDSALAAIRERALAIVEGFDPAEGAGIFSTQDQGRTADAWFLGSAAAVRCFFEEEAFDADGRLRQSKALSINKIGHALHDLDPVFERFSREPRLAALAQDLGLADARLWQSMFIFKQPAIGGEVRWHQDASFLHAEPGPVLGLWFALEDATRDNGCLWVQPGGQLGPLRERFVREGDSVRMQPLDATPWPSGDEALALEVPAGTLVCFDGALPHYSAPNRSARSRHAYTLHLADGGSRWLPSNWLQRPAEMPVRGFR